MEHDGDTVRVARRAADRLAAEIGPRLPEQVEQALAEDPLGRAPERAIDPISVASLIVSVVALGWTIYRDIKKDRDAARGSQATRVEWLSVRLRQDGLDIMRRAATLDRQQQDRIIEVIAEEITATPPED